MAISMLKIRRPLGRLIFNMGIAIPGKTVFLIETAPCIPRGLRVSLTDISWPSLECITWISDSIYVEQWHVITHPCPNFSFSKAPFKWGRRAALWLMISISERCITIYTRYRDSHIGPTMARDSNLRPNGFRPHPRPSLYHPRYIR